MSITERYRDPHPKPSVENNHECFSGFGNLFDNKEKTPEQSSAESW